MPIQFHKPNHGRINANYVEHGKQANGTILHRKQKVSVLDVLQISPSYFYIVNILWALNTSKKLENYLNDTKAYFSRQFAQNYLTTYRQKAFARFKGSHYVYSRCWVNSSTLDIISIMDGYKHRKFANIDATINLN